SQAPSGSLSLGSVGFGLYDSAGSAMRSLAALRAGHEHQALEQMHVLLVLEQRAVQGRDDRLAVLRAQRVWRNVLGEQQLQPVEELRGGGLFLQARDFA